ncbi:MAG: cyclopropane fatty acyl phospholipid synthase [Deltaproteobacteria bacterium]|nr:cyclopropane fatty acyl phospholipid synthase [Deltaproteobacteria bacterium]
MKVDFGHPFLGGTILPRSGPRRIASGKASVSRMFAKAGVKINGRRPWDIQVHNDKFYDRLLADGSLGVGESYVDGWWDSDRLDDMAFRVFRAKVDRDMPSWAMVFDTLRAKIFNLQVKSRAFFNAGRHYDIGDDLYAAMLDRRMVYSCGLWTRAQTLDEAQEHKLELCCKKLDLRPGMKVLDIGSGWGAFAKYAAEKHRVRVTGITVSKNQLEYAKKHTQGHGIEFRLQDYRDLKKERFDRVVSIGMFEHVGYKNYRHYMEIVAERCLADDGLFLLHTIGGNVTTNHIDPWIDRYIFPNSMLPSISQVGEAIEGHFVMEDWHNLGTDYDKTLMAWFAQFHRHWADLREKYSKKFYRMWKFYLLSCAGAFRARDMQVWQILLSKRGKLGDSLRHVGRPS